MSASGPNDQPTLDARIKRGAEPTGASITIDQSAARHIIRMPKADRHRMIPSELLREMPRLLAAPKAILLAKTKRELLYIFDVPGGDGRLGKLVVRLNVARRVRLPGGKRQTVVANAVIAAGLVPAANLRDVKQYELLSGSL